MEKEKDREKMLTLKDEFVRDNFYHNGYEIVVLENNAFKNVDPDVLILGKIVETEKESIIEPLTEEEYEEAAKKYVALLELFSDEEENNE